jgi:FdrA protein
MNATIKFFRDTYIDSVVQLAGMRAMREIDGVSWASAGMATPANLELLQAEGVDRSELAGAKSNDFVLVVRADDPEVLERALAAGESTVFSAHTDGGDQDRSAAPRSVRAAMRAQPDSNVAVISVPGDYAPLAAYQALSAGMHVLLFSDNVPVDKEIALKEYAVSRGLFVMGPGAGTALLGGACLGFANVVSRGPVGVVAAAGTGAQEAMALLERWGVGVAQVIGLGGRDMSAAVGGRMARSAIAALRADRAVEVILFVSKPPDAEVAAAVLAGTGDTPLVAAFIGLDRDVIAPPGVVLADTLESGVVAALRAVHTKAPDTTRTLGPSVASVRDRLPARRSLIRGLFSGGTLCYESLVILRRVVGEVRSNTPIDAAWGMPAPPGSHQCLDLGEEEYTKGRPHPMIDAEARIELLREHAADPQVAAIILDVVLGYGANPDPAGVLAPVCESVMGSGGPQIVAYVLGTEGDPQGFNDQRDRLVTAGCIVTETSARASLVAAAIATGDPTLVAARL